MKLQALTIAFCLAAVSAFAPTPAEAAIPCDTCQATLDACMSTGGSFETCIVKLLPGCHDCPVHPSVAAEQNNHVEAKLKPKDTLLVAR